MHALLALALLAAPGDIMVLARSSGVTLTSGQRTTLATGVTAQWPTVALADIVGFHADRRAGTAFCSVMRSEVLDAPTLFGLLVAGETITPGLAATARSRWMDPAPCVAGMTTALGTLVSAIASGATAARTREFDCVRQGTEIVCSVAWAKSYTAAAVFTEMQNGTTLVPLGVE